MSNLSLDLTGSQSRHPDLVAIRADEYELTYAGLDDASARLAGVLGQRSLQVGDRAAIVLRSLPAFAILYFAILRAGGIAIPMNPLKEFVRTRIAAYRHPRRVWIVDALPKGPTGKVPRRSVSSPASV